MRSGYGTTIRSAYLWATVLVAAGSALPRAVAAGDAPVGSTLEPQIAPHSQLDVTIGSLIQRGLIADPDSTAAAVTTPTAPAAKTPAAPAATPPAAAAPSLGWRSSSILKKSAPVEERVALKPEPLIAPSEPSTPALADPNTPRLADASASAAPLASAKTPEPASQPTPAEIEADKLAPIDELSEDAAPSTDTLGDGRIDDLGEKQIEEALDPSAIATDAKPIEQAPKLAPASPPPAPLGEPDRIEVEAKNAPAPVDPDSFGDADSQPQAPTKPLKPLTRNQIALRSKIRSVLKYYYDRPLNTGDRGPWEVMHCTLAFELHSRIRQGGPTGAPITAAGWLCFNQPCRNRTLMYLNEDKELRVKVGPALQGHQGQLLAILAQARVRSDYPIKVEGRNFTIADLVDEEKSTCYPKTELTFKLIGLLNYLPNDATWVNDQGMTWDIPRLMAEEMAQPVRTAACGGTHRLSGLSLAVKKRTKLGLPVDGQYAKAATFVANYQRYAYSLQNPDGSFSTEWFRGPGAEEDIDRRLKTTGHTLEWLMYASAPDQLQYYRNVRAVNYLANIMWANRGRDWEAGPLGHAIHSLVLYDRLIYGPYDSAEQQAKAPGTTTTPAPKVAKAPQKQSKPVAQNQSRRKRR